MGKVRILLIKRVAKQMVAKYPERFSRDFDQNKKALEELHLTQRLRNRVAGYISSLMAPSKGPKALGEEKPIFGSEFDAELGLGESQIFDQEGEPVNPVREESELDEGEEKLQAE